MGDRDPFHLGLQGLIYEGSIRMVVNTSVGKDVGVRKWHSKARYLHKPVVPTV